MQCNGWPVMIKFLSGAVAGPDGLASMGKCMAWAFAFSVLISWFAFPSRSITELAAVLGGILAYIYGGKASWNKNNSGDKPNDR